MSQWELLVTEGHVRAARWRNVAPVVFTGAIVAVIGGVLLGSLAPERAPSTQVSDAQAVYAEAQRRAISAFMQGADRDAVSVRAGEASTPDAAATQIATVVAALNAKGRLPADVQTETPDDFWRGGWEPGALHVIRRDRTVIIGQFIAISPVSARQPPVLARQYVLVRRGPDSQWQSYCLTVAGDAPCDGERLDPTSIPATTRSLLPRAAFADGGEG